MNFPAEFFQDEYRCDFLVPELIRVLFHGMMTLISA